MKKIALVVVRYGLDINGGAEYHCRMLAERLADKYDTEVLTTCVKDYIKGGNDYEPGLSVINGVTVRRFSVKPYDREAERSLYKKVRRSMSLRKRLGKRGLLRLISKFATPWQWGLKTDRQIQKNSVFYSEDMVNFMSAHKDEYDAFFAFSVDYAPFYFTAMIAGEKMIAVPTMHDAKVTYRPTLTEAFPKIRYVGFNTVAEQKLGRRIFGKGLKDNGILSVGIETVEPAPWADVKKKYSLPDRYACFVGRVCVEKIGKLATYYEVYQHKYGANAIPLVVVGNAFGSDVTLPQGTVCTGFVSDEEKRAIMKHATVFINPSRYESLSLVLLEAMNDRVPVIVNGFCNVLRDHCNRSGGAVKYYTNRRNFSRILNSIVTDSALADRMREQGEKYYKVNYSWDLIMKRLDDAIKYVCAR